MSTTSGLDPVDAAGTPRYPLTASERERIGWFFDTYERHEPGRFCRLTGWGNVEEGLAFVRTTHGFFKR